MDPLTRDDSTLRSKISGQIFTPTSAGYDEQRAQYNGMIDRHPSLIIRIADESDAAAAIAYALDHELEVAVRSGGHSSPGHGTVDDGLVIDVRDLKTIHVDPARRTVRCGAGVTWGELDKATQEHGLAVTGGRVSSTGVSGFAIGSGSGWLERVMGLAPDNLIGLTMVAADGRIVEASLSENFDLLWSSRGGGGNFGVITELEFSLIPIGPATLGGVRYYPMARALDVAKAYRDLNETAPAELCTGLTFQIAPPAPFLPAELHGQPVAGLFALWAGPVDDAAYEGIALLDALGEPLVDLIDVTEYATLQSMTDANYPSGNRDYFKGGFIDELSDEAIEAMIGFGNDLKATRSNIIILPLGEKTAYAKIAPEDSPLGHRGAKWSFQVLSLWEDAAEDDLHRDWTRDVAKAMSTYSNMVAFPNFLAGSQEELKLATRAYSEESLTRLRAVKRKWDPQNVFKRNVVSLA